VTQNFVINYGLGLPSATIVRNGGADQRYYVYLPDGTLLYGVDAGGTVHHYFHFDESGNTLFLSDDSGNVTDSYGITAYGESVIATGSTPNPFTWQGRFGVMQESGTSMYFLRARYYDSAPARFLSPDPVDGLSPQAINPYQYALENPANLIDPTGLSPGQITNTTNFPSLLTAFPSSTTSAVAPFTNPFSVSRETLGFEKSFLVGPSTISVYGPPSSLPSTTSSAPPVSQPPATCLPFNPCATNLLFPFITNASGFNTGLALPNTSKDPFGSTLQSGTCTLNYYQSGTSGATAPNPCEGTTRPFLPDQANPFTTTQSPAINTANPATFQGYIIARCNFFYATGSTANLGGRENCGVPQSATNGLPPSGNSITGIGIDALGQAYPTGFAAQPFTRPVIPLLPNINITVK
jgi:RHS repeat-associated protein